MPNFIDRARRLKLKKAFAMGLSVREAGKFAGTSYVTASRYAGNFPFSCPCGRSREAHKSMCPVRFKRHPKRQAFMEKWLREQKGATDVRDIPEEA